MTNISHKKARTLILVILAISFSFVVVACGGGDEPPLPTSGPTRTPRPPTVTPAPELPTLTPTPSIDDHLDIGNAYYEKGELDKAVLEYKTAIELEPDNPYAHRGLGSVYYLQQDRTAEALAEFEIYLQLAPNAPDRAVVEDDIAKLTALIADSSEDSETGVKTYDNKYLGLTMEYPADWVLRDNISGEGAVIVLGSNADFANVSDPAIFTEPGASIQISMKDLRQFLATNLVDLQDEFIGDVYPPMSPINEVKPISIPGDLGNAVVGIDGGYISELDNGQTLRFGVTTLVQSGRAIVMVAIFGEDYEEQVLPVIQTVFSSIDWKLTAPELLMNVIFTAAQREDYSILNVLCHPDVDNNSDTQAICDIATDAPASQSEFARYFKGGKLTGMAHFSEDGKQAQVPFLFGPDGDLEETMTFILHDGEWFLYSF